MEIYVSKQDHKTISSMGVLFNTSYPFRLSDSTKTQNACGRSNKKKLFAKIILGISLGKISAA